MIPVCKTDKENALNYHRSHRPGKLEIKPTVPFATQCDMSLAYTPGVAYACLEIEQEPNAAYSYTTKGNLIAVVSNGTAVLGLGNIGALASKPVMEGKAILFKSFANLDSFDIEVDETDIDKFCDVVAAIAPTFGGINLEDIKAPECFEIEKRLVERLEIPVMHDDQHGTAVISAAGMINACLLTERKIEDLKIVIVGAGAAAIMCGRMYRLFGAKDITLIDSTGVVHNGRDDLNEYKAMFAIEEALTQDEAFNDADMVVGLSRHGTISSENIAAMAKNPIVFTLANPTPEIYPDEVKKIRDDAIIATGRTDYPNQVNNVLGFPFIFRGAMDVHATKINDAMKVAAAEALAALAREDVPHELHEVYNEAFSFSKEYIIPKPFDKRLFVEISSAVAKAAFDSGVAGVKRCDIPAYKELLYSFNQK
jgi:malate dehydrogenase (oxaloacetate-decarboxylating)/malate dehydrogenase (oxaloacetate-decarboxylating)(NADP+)